MSTKTSWILRKTRKLLRSGLFWIVLIISIKSIMLSLRWIPIDKKVILTWTTYYKQPNMGDKYFDHDRCPGMRRICEITTNRSEYTRADAIVFHPRDDMNWSELPPMRFDHQRYVFILHESPKHTWFDLDHTPGFFNWSFTYRLDSDVPYPFGRIGRVPSAARKWDDIAAIVKNKTIGRSMIIWFVSNCKTVSKREAYVRELEKIIPIDIYGDCGPLKCPKKDRSKCEEDMEKRYKFYIAFENSICTDYITEKYFDRFYLISIPLVLSRRIAEPYFPPNSFIAIDDFTRGPRQLADYLRYLDGNTTAYLEYFHWRTIGYDLVDKDPVTGRRFGFCGLCERLWRKSDETKVLENVNDWWGKGKCDSGLVERLLRGIRR